MISFRLGLDARLLNVKAKATHHAYLDITVEEYRKVHTQRVFTTADGLSSAGQKVLQSRVQAWTHRQSTPTKSAVVQPNTNWRVAAGSFRSLSQVSSHGSNSHALGSALDLRATRVAPVLVPTSMDSHVEGCMVTRSARSLA